MFMLEEEIEVCEYGNCDGSGLVTTGEFDDQREEKCICQKDREILDYALSITEQND